MRVIILTHGGADLVIRELSAVKGVELGGVFIETRTTPERRLYEKVRRSVKYDGLGATAAKLFRIGRNGSEPVAANQDLTRHAASELGVNVTEVLNFHSEIAKSALRSVSADLGVIYGTNIIKEEVFSIPKMGSINLHQGMAPYYRGGPPIFWELFNDEPRVGVTVHFVAAKVDTGDIVLQKEFPLRYDKSFELDFESFIASYRNNLRSESASLLAMAVAAIASGEYKRIPQDTSLGRRHRLPTKSEKNEMRRRLRARLGRMSDE